jgi:hypothetical protein
MMMGINVLTGVGVMVGRGGAPTRAAKVKASQEGVMGMSLGL